MKSRSLACVCSGKLLWRACLCAAMVRAGRAELVLVPAGERLKLLSVCQNSPELECVTPRTCEFSFVPIRSLHIFCAQCPRLNDPFKPGKTGNIHNMQGSMSPIMTVDIFWQMLMTYYTLWTHDGLIVTVTLCTAWPAQPRPQLHCLPDPAVLCRPAAGVDGRTVNWDRVRIQTPPSPS